MVYEFELVGAKPLLLHADNVEWADVVRAWRLDPNNAKKKGEGSGDDRRPAWSWVGYCYTDEQFLTLPSANLQSCLRKAGSRVSMGKRTAKEIAVSGVFFTDEHLKFTTSGKQVPYDAVRAFLDQPDFATHITGAQKLGFKLDVRRAVVGTAKHVRVRPRFETWTVSGTLEVTADEITHDLLVSIFEQAGRVGLGDWRPGAKTPGVYGMFSTNLKRID